MDPSNISFNTLIVGLPNSGETQYFVNQLRGLFCDKFDYIVLLCLTFIHNKPFNGFVDNKPCMSVIGCLQNDVKFWLRLASFFFEGMSMLIILQMTVLL